MFVTVALLLVLTQEAPEPEASPAAPPSTPAAAPAAAPAQRYDAPPPRLFVPDELPKLLQKLKDAPLDQRPVLLEELQRKFGAAAVNPVLPPSDIDVAKYRELSDAEQAKLSARDFVADLLAVNISGAVSRCGLPFMLEGQRIDRPDELRTEWAKHLRSKRTDLLALYDVEVLTAADMEKKFGRPPQRLANWPWRNPGTLVAIANLSGHAAVLLLRQAGAVWQVVAFTD
ncbi:MAG: hypothetical protein JNG84_07005 [Archangium sp.]|nr:hypothetical protein [Archangium sp.]